MQSHPTPIVSDNCLSWFLAPLSFLSLSISLRQSIHTVHFSPLDFSIYSIYNLLANNNGNIFPVHDTDFSHIIIDDKKNAFMIWIIEQSFSQYHNFINYTINSSVIKSEYLLFLIFEGENYIFSEIRIKFNFGSLRFGTISIQNHTFANLYVCLKKIRSKNHTYLKFDG